MILAALALVVAEPPPSAAPPPAERVESAASIVLPAGTAVRLVTVGAVDSRSAKQGQRFVLALAEDVTVGSTVVIPRGTAAVGEVEAVSGKGAFGMPAHLVLRPLFVEVTGERINLVGLNKENGQNNVAAAAITTAITPLGLLITGKSATVPAGSVILGRVRSDVTVPVGAVQSSPPAPTPPPASADR